MLDPAASHGVLRAIMSGARAGLAAALCGHSARRDGSALAFAEFDAWFRAGALRDADVLRRVYATSMREKRRAG